jgi:hypothetical protein
MSELQEWIDTHDIKCDEQVILDGFMDNLNEERNEIMKQFAKLEINKSDLFGKLSLVHAKRRFIEIQLENIVKK